MSSEVGSNTPSALRNILLVDDEPSVLFALKLLMEAVGYRVKDFCSAADALAYLKDDSESELFICDLRMPKMNGLAVLQEAKRLKPELPFVLMSAHANSEEQERARALGGEGFLAKPFMPDQLHEMVRSIAEKRTARA